MNWTEKQMRYIILEMAEENTLACKALFCISRIRFTREVKTMSVNLSRHPELLINLDFCRQHLQRESDVKAVLMHEFLHVILLHTEKYELSNPFLNIALDAIINAIIYRYMGMEYADLFVRLYEWEPISMLLRPAAGENYRPEADAWNKIHMEIYEGKYCADDLYELLLYIQSESTSAGPENILLLGQHTPTEISGESRALLNGIMKRMNGTRIWSKSRLPGIGEAKQREERNARNRKLQNWSTVSRKMLEKCLRPDKRDKSDTAKAEIVLPAISNTDRHSLARYMYSGLIPFSVNHNLKPIPSEKATIYLDVSGSMNSEIDRIIDLLHHFRSSLKMPLYVFSNDVHEARFSNGQLVFDTTCGTSIEPVFAHIRENDISKCLIVTDGYIAPIEEYTLSGLNRKKIHLLISSEGDPGEFAKAGFPYQQLRKF